ncbi:ATP-binding protein [Amycolatopsis minnesotensis]|uniref:ATP-binding protein n=1 Tax=Amycolatopsis minnesotensis TaxID=337894 RepID=A0ABN2Q6J3_9PSEU
MGETTPAGEVPNRFGGGRPRSMAERVRQLRRQGFVGRASERRAFASALRGGHNDPRVLLLHGPGGIGKSALLRRLADDAEDLGHTVVWVHGEYVAASATEFAEAAAPVWTGTRPVLLIDGFEHCQVLETWLREHFLSTVPDDTVVVVAGRRRPEPHWTLDPGWRRVALAIALPPLNPLEASVLLGDRGVPGALHPAVNRFAAGHPLALCLAAEAPSADDTAWEPSPDVIETLLTRMIDRVPSAAHEYGLRVGGHVRHVTIDLLRTGLAERDALAVFDWLAALPYVEPGKHGLVAHEQVREALDTSFRWRDPTAYAELHVRLWRHLSERVKTASEDTVTAVATERLYLYRYGAHDLSNPFEPPSTENLFERHYTPDLREDVLRLAREDQGERGARLVAHWLDRQPGAFSVYCRANDLAPVAFFAGLRLGPDFDDWERDPALAPVREHLDRTGGMAPGQYVGIARFMVPAPPDDTRLFEATGVNLHTAHITSANLREQGGLVASFVVAAYIDVLAPGLELFDYKLLRAVPELGDQRWGVVVHDWRGIPLTQWLERISVAFGWTNSPGHGSGTPPALARPAFDEAVKQALLDWHDDGAIAANPLTRTYGDGDALRAAVTAAALREDPRYVKHQRVVRATYFDRRTTQEAAAARLGLPYGTYRRHLRTGVQQLCDALWNRA